MGTFYHRAVLPVNGGMHGRSLDPPGGRAGGGSPITAEGTTISR